MKTAIIYTSVHGTTEKVAGYMAKKLNAENPAIIPLKKVGNSDIEDYDRIILGASVHMGVIPKAMKRFCSENLSTLLKKELGLFVCGMEADATRQQAELEIAYPCELYNQAKAKAFAGGEFLFEKMNFIQRAIIKKIGKVNTTISDIKYDEVDHFISLMQK
ncbi:MAG: flavodoxin [Bacteroidetes bacterium]|nr:flavodoxin [Bacteroidota bacterium]